MVSSTNHPIALPFQLLKKKKIKTIEAVGLPCSSNGKEICLQYRRLRFDPWVGENPLEKGMAIHSSILA